MTKNKSVPVKALALANLLAAFGGGTILGKAMGVLKHEPWLKGDTIVAFTFGTAIGLLLLFSIPKSIIRKIHPILSIGAAGCSLVLLSLLNSFSQEGPFLIGLPAWSFFLILCLRFSLWFLSRVIRSDISAGHNQKISWVELYYYLGIILGLVLWQRSGLTIAIEFALILDSLFQCAACGLDILSSRRQSTITPKTNGGVEVEKTPSPLRGSDIIPMIVAVVAITVAIQVGSFAFAYGVHDLSADIIASFYGGAALAAIVCGKYKVALKWKETTQITFTSGNSERSFSFSIILIVSALLMASAFLFGMREKIEPLLIIALVVAAAFMYEIVALALLDMIGFKANAIGRKGIVSFSFGFMGFGSSLALFGILQSNNLFLSLFLVLIASIMATLFSMMKKVNA